MPVANGFTISAKIYTVPGQVAYANTRKVVLQNVDAVVFIADSQRNATSANAWSFQDLGNNLKELKVEVENLPLVVQFNKRDLPDIRPMKELEEAWKARGMPVYAASAIRRDGVMSTLEGILRLLYRNLAGPCPWSRPVASARTSSCAPFATTSMPRSISMPCTSRSRTSTPARDFSGHRERRRRAD